MVYYGFTAPYSNLSILLIRPVDFERLCFRESVPIFTHKAQLLKRSSYHYHLKVKPYQLKSLGNSHKHLI